MKRAFQKSSPSPRPTGLTLVEVIAGTAVMGTLLVMLLTAGANLTAQSAKAQQAQQACRFADEFLESSWKDKSKFPIDQAGELPGHPGWKWRTRLCDSRDLSTSGLNSDVIGDLKIHPVRLDVFAPGAGTADAPNVSVEVLLPDRPTSTSQQVTSARS